MNDSPQYHWDVFVSHSGADRKAADTIVRELIKADLRPWYDVHTLQPGKRIREAIAQGIRRSACVLVILSTNSLKSRWVLNELDAAMLREIRERRSLVIPILIGRIKEAQIPEDVGGKLYIDLRHNFTRRFSGLMPRIVQSVKIAAGKTQEASQMLRGDRHGVAALLTREYRNKSVDRIPDRIWDHLMRIFARRKHWGQTYSDFTEFRSRFGTEAVKRLFMYIADGKGLDLANANDWSEALADILFEAQWFIYLFAPYNFLPPKRIGTAWMEFGMGEDEKDPQMVYSFHDAAGHLTPRSTGRKPRKRGSAG